MTPQEMRALFDYNAWANRRSLEAASALTSEKFVQPMGSSFGSVRDTLAHIWGAEWIWLERFQGRSPSSLPDATQFPDMASLRERWDELEARLLGFVRGLAQADLDGPDALLSRACDGGGRVVSAPHTFRGNHSHDCVDEGAGAASACGEPRHRTGPHDGRAASRASCADRASEAGMFDSDCIHFCESKTVWTGRRFFQISPHLRP